MLRVDDLSSDQTVALAAAKYYQGAREVKAVLQLAQIPELLVVPVDPTSRYAGAADDRGAGARRLDTRDGRPARSRPSRRSRAPTRCVAGDRLDLLGRAATGDTTRWWVLADANRWPDATQLEQPGQTIGLPDA